MASTTLTVRVEESVKERLEELAERTDRSRSFLAAEAISEYLDIHEWQIAGINQAIASLDRGEGIAHQAVKEWVGSWNTRHERPAPKRSGA
jgi:predicted transcriptional regulator